MPQVIAPVSTFTRPANTTAYASGDLIANSTTAADFLNATSIPWFNANQGAFAVEGRMVGIGGTFQNLASFGASGPLNQNTLALNVDTGGVGTGNAWVGGVNKFANIAAHTAGASFKQALSYKNGEYKAALNGTRATTGSLYTVPTNLNRREIKTISAL